jgi:hypothetical protein
MHTTTTSMRIVYDIDDIKRSEIFKNDYVVMAYKAANDELRGVCRKVVNIEIEEDNNRLKIELRQIDKYTITKGTLQKLVDAGLIKIA